MLYFMFGIGLGAYFMSLYHTHDKNIAKVIEHAQRDGYVCIEKIKQFCGEGRGRRR